MIAVEMLHQKLNALAPTRHDLDRLVDAIEPRPGAMLDSHAFL